MIPIALGKKLFKDAKVRRKKIFAAFSPPIVHHIYHMPSSNISRIRT
jgi:hypothetical protein